VYVAGNNQQTKGRKLNGPCVARPIHMNGVVGVFGFMHSAVSIQHPFLDWSILCDDLLAAAKGRQVPVSATRTSTIFVTAPHCIVRSTTPYPTPPTRIYGESFDHEGHGETPLPLGANNVMVETYTVPVSRKHRHDMADHSDMAMDLDPDSVIGTMVLDSEDGDGDVDTPLDLRAELHFRAKDVLCSTLPWHVIILRPRKLYTFSVADNARMLHSIKIRPTNPAKPALSTITIATFRKSSMTPQTFRKLKLVTDPDMRTDFLIARSTENLITGPFPYPAHMQYWTLSPGDVPLDQP
jgi:hypothetical protein